MKLAVGILALALASGCSASESLPAEWFPLERVEQIRELPLASGRVATIYSTLYTRDLKAFDEDYPSGSLDREALLRHERVHAIHEFQDPTLLARYTLSKDVRWEEERAGYHEEILWLVKHGAVLDARDWALMLTVGYTGLDGPMVSYDVALAWVEGELAADLKAGQ